MNKLVYSFISSLILLIALFIFAKSALISNYQRQIEEEKINYENKYNEYENLQKVLRELESEANQNKDSEQLKIKKQLVNWLFYGDEGKVITMIADFASKTNVIISKLKVSQPIFIKHHEYITEKNNTNSEIARSLSKSDASQIDETNYATNISYDDPQEQQDWTGIEFMPLVIELKGIYNNLAIFLRKFILNIPNYIVHSLDFKIDNDGIVKGQLTLLFPTFSSSKLTTFIDTTQETTLPLSSYDL